MKLKVRASNARGWTCQIGREGLWCNRFSPRIDNMMGHFNSIREEEREWFVCTTSTKMQHSIIFWRICSWPNWQRRDRVRVHPNGAHSALHPLSFTRLYKFQYGRWKVSVVLQINRIHHEAGKRTTQQVAVSISQQSSKSFASGSRFNLLN